MMLSSWGWPQYAIVILWALELLKHSAFNGDPRKDKYCAACRLVDTAIIGFILFAGGFWS